jgi:hypothetical protein
MSGPSPAIEEALDVERLARALIEAVREVGTRNRPDLPDDGWPAYWTSHDEASVLLVSDLAESIAAAYVRLASEDQR